MIKIKNVTKTINNKVVLENINVNFKEGEITLLCGHNGCGKTMLLRLACGFINSTSGERLEEKEYKYGVIIETPTFFLQETAFQNLKYLASINKTIADKEIELWLKKFNLYEQRLALCQAFMEDPDVLLLDEPFNAIDDENLKIVCDLIKEAKKNDKIIVIASHSNIDNLKFDNVVRMSDGKIKEITNAKHKL